MTACARVALSAFALLVALESLDAFHISSPTLLRPRATGRCHSRLRRLELRATSDSDRVGTGNGGVAPDGGHTTRAEQLSTELRKAKTFREAWEARFRGLGVDIAPPAHKDLSPELHALLPEPLASGEDLADLRARVKMLAGRLELAIEEERYGEAAALRDEMRSSEVRDPLVFRARLTAQLAEAAAAEDYDRAGALVARIREVEGCIPVYRLAGRWVGTYGPHGEEEVVVTYDGSTLRGTKLTGDENVPAGQISFEADLSAQLPRVVGGAGEAHVTERIRAVMESHVPVEAYKGRAQIAEKGFKRPQWIDGQLLLFQDGVFGFLFLQVPPAARPPCAQHRASQQQLLHHTLQQQPPHSSLQQSHSAAHCSTAQRAAADCGATAQLGSLIMFENCEARERLAAEKRAVGGDTVESERPPQADTGTVRFL